MRSDDDNSEGNSVQLFVWRWDWTPGRFLISISAIWGSGENKRWNWKRIWLLPHASDQSMRVWLTIATLMRKIPMNWLGTGLNVATTYHHNPEEEVLPISIFLKCCPNALKYIREHTEKCGCHLMPPFPEYISSFQILLLNWWTPLSYQVFISWCSCSCIAVWQCKMWIWVWLIHPSSRGVQD